MSQDATWQPDYAELIARTGYSRSWCEKRVAQARQRMAAVAARRTPTPPAEAIRAEPPRTAVSVHPLLMDATRTSRTLSNAELDEYQPPPHPYVAASLSENC